MLFICATSVTFLLNTFLKWDLIIIRTSSQFVLPLLSHGFMISFVPFSLVVVALFLVIGVTTMLIIVLYVLSRSGFNVCLQRDVLSSYDVHSEADETVISAE